MQAPQKNTLVGLSIGKYRISRQLGHGSFGDIYEILQGSIGYRAAIKVLPAQLAQDPGHQQFVSRFFDEARVVNYIDHPGIVKIFDLDELPDHSLYIMMEYIDGQSLTERLRGAPGTRLPIADALRITRQIASVMKHVHAKGVLHRDLKPDSIILVADAEAPDKQRIKLVDFGLVKFLDSPERRTSVGMALGTPTYMAPEQCLGSETLEGRADVYSLGVMLYEMIAGRTPFSGSQREIMTAHVNTNPPPLRDQVPGLPDTVYQLVEGMLTKTVVQRWDMAQIEAWIEQIEASMKKSAAAPSAVQASGGGRRLIVPFGIAALLFAVINAGLWWGARGALERTLCTPQLAASAHLCPPPPSLPKAAAGPASEPGDVKPAASPPNVQGAPDKSAAEPELEGERKAHKAAVHKGEHNGAAPSHKVSKDAVF